MMGPGLSDGLARLAPEDSRYRQSAVSILWCLEESNGDEADESDSSLKYGGSSKGLRASRLHSGEDSSMGQDYEGDLWGFSNHNLQFSCRLSVTRPSVLFAVSAESSLRVTRL
jgi:hypothetical protein